MATRPKLADPEPVNLKARLSSWWQRHGSASEQTGEGALPTRWWELAGYGGLLAVGAIMRLWDLGSRAMHHDESLHAFYSWQLYNGGGFQHTPMMHGPLQFEANAAIFFVFGDSDVSARLLYALMGAALVALPFFFRHRLGRPGALAVAVLLTFSPVMLYFSRFARNDILMAVWTLGLVIAMWRYIDEGKSRYLYISSALLALAFATKETVFILAAILGLFLIIVITPGNWAVIRQGIEVRGVSPPVALGRLISAIWSAYQRGVDLSKVSRPASFLILLVTLTLPQWSASVSVFQNSSLLTWANLVLAAPEGSPAIGAPSGGGLVIAALVVIALLGLSVYWGYRWNWRVWWRSALIFWGVWALLYTTFFTNIFGIGSGMWQSLGYWVVQQGEARGGQPWYYYFVIGSVYEFLPLFFGVIAAIYYLRRKDLFGHFLVYWTVATFILYTMASEKMPWLLVNVALPLIVLSGKFLGDMVQRIQWRRLIPEGGVLLLPGVPLALFLLWRLAFFEPESRGAADILLPIGLAAGLLGTAALGVHLARRNGVKNLAAFAIVPIAVILLVLTIRAGVLASYRYDGDRPVEMIVYTQTSPDITRLRAEIERVGDATGQQGAVSIAIDQTSGFTWPWAWYLRDYTRVSYPSYSGGSLKEAPESSVLLVHSNNQKEADQVLTDRYAAGERFTHRWWFPETTYRGLTLGKFLGAFADRQAWRTAMDYFLYRKGVEDRLGREDAYIYFAPGPPQGSKAPP